jgi:hypothetical protein
MKGNHLLMQEHRQHIKRASAKAEDSWMSQHKFLKMLWNCCIDLK